MNELDIKNGIPMDKLILLSRQDVKELTGWGSESVGILFSDPDFPAIINGSRNDRVSNFALKDYFDKRRILFTIKR